jgi:DNA-binding CsgD family transcriptional regulator
MITRISDFIKNTNAAGSPADVIKLLEPQAMVYGCEFLAFGPTNPEAAQLMINVNPALPYITNYPVAWVKEYEENRYFEIDPVLIYCKTNMEAFPWDVLKEDPNMTPKVRKFWRDSEKHGLKCGITVPLHCPNGRGFAFSLATATPETCLACENLSEIQAVGYQFTIAYLNAGVRDKKILENPLSNREKEVLNWTAHGKSAWDISVILNISEHTVNFHLKNAIRKMDSTNKVSAVVKALRFGFIYL